MPNIPDGIFSLIKELALNTKYRWPGFIFSLCMLCCAGYFWYIMGVMNDIVLFFAAIGFMLVAWYFSLGVCQCGAYLRRVAKEGLASVDKQYTENKQKTQAKEFFSGGESSVLHKLEAQRRSRPDNPSVYLSDGDSVVCSLFERGFIKRDADKPERILGASDHQHAYFLCNT